MTPMLRFPDRGKRRRIEAVPPPLIYPRAADPTESPGAGFEIVVANGVRTEVYAVPRRAMRRWLIQIAKALET